MDTQAIQIGSQKGWQKLSGSTLKIIAMFCMFLDHFGAIVVYRIILAENFNIENYDKWRTIYQCLRNIGRTAFPIFCFLLVEGFLHTKSKVKYGIHLLLFALISEIPFDLAIYGKLTMNSQNVYFTLFIGLMVIFLMNKIKDANTNKSVFLLFFGYAMVVIPGTVMALLLQTDYSYFGIILIVIFYLFCDNRLMAGVVGFLSFLWEYFCFPAFLLIQCYNGKRGLKNKYFFYLFYPVHLLLLYLLSVMLGLIQM